MTSTTFPLRATTDVVVVGSGLTAATLTAVLARAGVHVLVVDAGTHPRFAVGESMLPFTSTLMRLVADRYGVPELKQLATFESCRARVTTQCGVQHNDGFVYHREGQRQQREECHQVTVPRVASAGNHLFRQDVDAWMLNVALSYGARLQQNVHVTDVVVDDDGVTVHGTGGPWRARYVVDASGSDSPLARIFGLREEPTRLRHRARALYTHMLDVLPYDDVATHASHGQPQRWGDGTLHHVFDGGWLWVIPFGNHARATNRLTSVGLCLDPRVHPAPAGLTPQEEFDRFLARFRDLEPQFAKARSVREWVSVPAVQYSSRRTVGHRWCVVGEAAGEVDPLFSTPLANGLATVNALAWRLLDALAADDFDDARFFPVQELQRALLDTTDELVADTYTSFGSFELWDAWFRLWLVQHVLTSLEANRAYAAFARSGDRGDVEALEQPEAGSTLPGYPPARALVAAATRTLDAVRAGRLSRVDAAAELRRLVADARFVPPALGLTDPATRWFDVTWPKSVRSLLWARIDAPADIGDLTYEGLTLFLKNRLNSDEADLVEGVKHRLAPLPVIGKKLRTPLPQ